MFGIIKRALKWSLAGLLLLWIGFALFWTFSPGAMLDPWGRTDPSAGKFAEGLILPFMAAPELAKDLFPQGEIRYSLGCHCDEIGYRLSVEEAARGWKTAGTWRWPNAIQWSGMQVRKQDGNVYFGWVAGAGSPAPPAAAFDAASWRSVAQDQWNAATPVVPNEVFSETPPSQHYFTFHGKRYQPSGERWFDGRPAATLSPDGKKIAMATFDGPVRPSGLYFLDPTRSWWPAHLEVFRIANGEVLLHRIARTSRSGRPPLGPRIVWATDRLLLASADDGMFAVSRCESCEPTELDYLHDEIVLDSGNMTARVALRPVSDQRGRTEALELTATFMALQPGEHEFGAILYRDYPRNSGLGSNIPVSLNKLRVLAAGSRTMTLLLEGSDLKKIQGPGYLVVSNATIRGPGETHACSRQPLATFPGIPVPDPAPFEMSAETSLEVERAGPPGQLTFRGKVKYISPGGQCNWSGAIVQEPRKVPVSGRQLTLPGPNWISLALSEKELSGFDWGRPSELRLIALDCDGRVLHPPEGEPYLGVYRFN